MSENKKMSRVGRVFTLEEQAAALFENLSVGQLRERFGMGAGRAIELRRWAEALRLKAAELNLEVNIQTKV